MPGPSRYNRRLKAKNDRKKAQASKGGRTPSEAGLARSMAASGKRVSRSNRRVGRGQPAATYRPSAPSAPQTISESRFEKAEPRRRAKEMERKSTRSMLSRISGQKEDRKAIRKATRKVRRTRAEADSPWKGPGKLAKRVETPAEFRKDQQRYNQARIDRRELLQGKSNKAKRTITNTAVKEAQKHLNTKGGRKDLPLIKKALKTQQGRTRFVGAIYQGDAEAVQRAGVPSRFTAMRNPYERANRAENRAKSGEERLRRKAQQIKAAETQIQRRIKRGDQAGAQRAYRVYQRQVKQYEKIAKGINRSIDQADKAARDATKQIAAGQSDSINIVGEGKNARIELPSETFQKDQVKATFEEGLGLGLSPLDIGTNIAGAGVAFKLGKGALGAARGAAAGAKATKGTNKKIMEGIVEGLAGSGTKTGKVGAKYIELAGSKTARGLYRWGPVVGLGGIAVEDVATGGQGKGVNFLESQAQAVIQDPLGLAKTSVRNALGGIAALPTIGANVAVTAKRGANVPFTDSDARKTADYVFKPTTQMAEAIWQEAQDMFNVYTSGDKDEMAEATIEDYGIAPLFASYYLTRPFLGGARRAIGKSGNLVTLPSYGVEPRLTPRLAGTRPTAYYAKEGINQLALNTVDRLTGAVGLDNPFTGSQAGVIFNRDKGLLARPNPASVAGRETIPQIRQRRRMTADAFRMKSRTDAMEATMNTITVQPFVEASQRYNGYAMNPAFRGAKKDVDDALDSINAETEAASRSAGFVGPMSPPITAQHLGVFLATKPYTRSSDPDNPEAPRTLIDEAIIREDIANLPAGSSDAILGRALLRVLDTAPEGSKQRQLIEDLASGAFRAGQIRMGLRVGQIQDNVPENEQAAKMLSDENARLLETVLAYERISGEPAPARPEVAFDQLVEDMGEIARSERLSLKEKKAELARLSSQALAARRAVNQRDIQNRINIKRFGLRGRLVDAKRRATRHSRNYHKAEATQWLISSGNYREMLTARLRDIAGNIASIEARRRGRSERVGELREREKRVRDTGQTSEALTPRERDAIQRWASEGAADPTQEAARGIRQSRAADQTRPFLESALAKQAPLTKELTVLRFISGGFERELDGNRSKGFVSTTSNLTNKGIGIPEGKRVKGKLVVTSRGEGIIIRIQPGSRVLNVPELLGKNPFSESEVLLPPGTRFTRVGESEEGTPIYEAVTPRPRRAEPETVDGTRAMAEQVARDQIDAEPNDAQLLRDLRAERDELQRQVKQIAKLEKEVKQERRLYESATKKVEKLRKQADSPVNPKMRQKADDLTGQEQVLRDFIDQQEELLRPYLREITAALDADEINAIVRRVEIEVAEEFGTGLSIGQWQRALSAKQARLERRVEELIDEREALRPITSDEAAELVARRIDLTDQAENLRAELATVLMAIRDGGRRRTAEREFEAAQDAMPERPSGRPYQPGEGRVPTIEGKSKFIEDMADEILGLEREIDKINNRLGASVAGEPPKGALKDLDEGIATAQAELAAIHTRLRLLRPQDIAALNPKRIRQARTAAAIGVAAERKRREAMREDMEARQAIYDHYAEEAYNYGLGEAIFLGGRPVQEIPGGNVEGPNVSRGLGGSYERQRTGELIRSGEVDRSPKRFLEFLNDGARAQARERTSQGLLTQAYRIEDKDGNQRIEMTREEYAMLIARGTIKGEDWVWMPVNMFYEPQQFNRMFDSLKAGATAGDIDDYVAKNLTDLAGSEIKLPSGEAQVAAAKLAEGGGVRGVLLPPQSVRVIIDSEKELAGYQQFFQTINKISSRLVLGTSVSWMLAQPIAEFLILVLDNPNPRRLLRGYLQAQEMRKTADGRRIMAMLSGSTYGMARDLRASARLQQDYDQAIKALRQMPITDLAGQFAKLEILGKFDRWKGAWIREIGAAAELDRELSTARRAAKAMLDQMDVIEKNAAKLSKMTPTERLRWTGTREGTAVANRIAKNLDDMLGNWTDVKPGLETDVGSVVFFYPFVRFSMRWTFDTFPKRHPVRASLAQIYGALNAEMLEHWLDFDPAWLSDWAAAPVFGGTDEEPIVSLVGLNRISPSGNALLEYGAFSENPFFNLTKAMPPPFGMLGRAMFGRDPYGAPLVDPDSPFGAAEWPGLGTIARQGIDEAANLIAPLRSAIRQTGYTPSKVIESGDLNPLDWIQGKGIITGKGIPDNRYQGQAEKPSPGDDQNFWRDLIRREAISLLPKPVNYYKTEQVVAKLYDLRNKSEKDAQHPYPKVKYRGRVDSLSEVRERIERERSRAQEEDKYGMRYGWNPTKEQQDLLDRAKKIKEIRDEGERWKEIAEEMIVEVYREQKLTMGQENKIRQAVVKRRRDDSDSIKREWNDRVADEMWASPSYPGEKQAQKEIRDLDVLEDTENGMTSLSGPVATNGKRVPKGKETPRRRNLVNTLRQDTRARLEEAGMRRVDLSDPTLDPATITKKTDEGKVVVRYRGRKVLGRIPLEAVRKAEKNNTLDVDEDGRLTIPQTRQTVAKAEQAGAQVVQQRKKINRLVQKAGGRVPVPGEEGVFVNTLARLTGLSPKVVAAWTRQEGGNSFGDWNRLNVGHTDSGPIPITNDPRWSNPKQAAELTNQFLRGEWGGASQGIQAILPNATGKSDQEQIDVITGSGWATDPDYRSNITSVYQSVPDAVPTDPQAVQKLKAARKQLTNIEKQYQAIAKEARAMGIDVKRPPASASGSYPAKEAKQLAGAWGGTERLLDMANGGDFEISSTKRTPSENEAVGGSSTSDHLTTNPLSFAHDLPTTDPQYGYEIMKQYHKRLKLNEPLQPTGTHNYTSRKYPGYTFQFIWQDSGHYDHVHIGGRYTGEDLPAGTYGGAAPGASYGSGGGGGYSGGGGAAMGGGNNPQTWQDADGEARVIAESQSNADPIFAAEQMAEVGEDEDGDVKSIEEAIAALPSVQARKKKSLRFDPKTRI